VKKTLAQVMGVAFAGVLVTVVASPAALAQDGTTTTTSTETTSTSETPTTTETSTTTTSTTTTTVPTPTGTTTTDPVKTTEAVKTGKADEERAEDTAPPKDPYKDNFGWGEVGLDGEGFLVIACAAGAPGSVATANLSVTAGPDQDGADGRLWDYSIRLTGPVTGPTSKVSWTCGTESGEGVVTIAQAPPPPTTTTTPTTTATAPTSSTGPITTAPVPTTTTAPAGNSAPKAQVEFAPKGGIETGFGGMA